MKNGKQILNVFTWILAISFIPIGVWIFNCALQSDQQYTDIQNKYYAPAVQDYNAHHYEKAIQKLQVVLQLHPEDYYDNFEMGVVLLKMDRKEEARNYFVKAKNSFLIHRGKFSSWGEYDAAQARIDQINQSLLRPNVKERSLTAK